MTNNNLLIQGQVYLMPCAVLRGSFTLQFLAYDKDILSLSFLYQEDWNSLFLAFSVVDRSIVVKFTSERNFPVYLSCLDRPHILFFPPCSLNLGKASYHVFKYLCLDTMNSGVRIEA